MLAPKLLVPIGCMPAALADGGPIVFCDSFGVTPAGIAQSAAAHADMISDGASAHGQTAANGHDEHPGSGHHEQWESCALGGLASLAAITHDWSWPLTNIPADSRIEHRSTSVAGGAPAFAFRPRAPPITRS